MSDKKDAVAKKGTDAEMKKHSKKVLQYAPGHAKKHAKKEAKKHAKKATRHMENKDAVPKPYTTDHGLMTAFHHMQRASIVISLMEKGTGEDLRDLLERGVKLYRKAVEEGDPSEDLVLRAIGVLRASEHLSMAGLYAAREKHRQKVASPTPEWLQKTIGEIDHRLAKVEHEKRGKGVDLFPVTVELLRQAEDADHDAHLAFELVMAGDALCFALENGL